MTRTKIQKWGNGLALRIPKSIAAEVGVEAGSTVHLAVEDGDVVIRPLRRRGYVLRELVAAITPENLRREIKTGTSMDREAW